MRISTFKQPPEVGDLIVFNGDPSNPIFSKPLLVTFVRKESHLNAIDILCDTRDILRLDNWKILSAFVDTL